jgi:GNAT superfamily N-acetyltransferase
VLRDGTAVEVRALTPADAGLLRAGFRELSRRSRVWRFLHDKQGLSDRELRYLTEFDGEHHFALGVSVREPGGAERGVGVARFVRLAQAPETAEVAITVVDTFQRRGVGRLLAERLARAARERGVLDFACWVMPGNVPMQQLLESLGPSERRAEGDALLYTVALPALPEQAPAGPLGRRLAFAAREAFVLLDRVRHLPFPGTPAPATPPPDSARSPWGEVQDGTHAASGPPSEGGVGGGHEEAAGSTWDALRGTDEAPPRVPPSAGRSGAAGLVHSVTASWPHLLRRTG